MLGLEFFAEYLMATLNLTDLRGQRSFFVECDPIFLNPEVKTEMFIYLNCRIAKKVLYSNNEIITSILYISKFSENLSR